MWLFLNSDFFFIPLRTENLYLAIFRLNIFFRKISLRKKVAITFIIFFILWWKQASVLLYLQQNRNIETCSQLFLLIYVCFLWMTGEAGNINANKSVQKSNQYRAQGLQQTDIDQDRTHTHTQTWSLACSKWKILLQKHKNHTCRCTKHIYAYMRIHQWMCIILVPLHSTNTHTDGSGVARTGFKGQRSQQ